MEAIFTAFIYIIDVINEMSLWNLHKWINVKAKKVMFGGKSP